tara:strand:- start:401 stop:553 length:153 start_codon:yes stop_codon:yes gene_type:complete
MIKNIARVKGGDVNSYCGGPIMTNIVYTVNGRYSRRLSKKKTKVKNVKLK